MQWCSWFRHSATSQVTGLIPNGVTGIFHWRYPSGHAMALGVDSASNRNEYQEYFLGSKGSWCIWLTTLPSSCADLEIWEPQPSGTIRACTRIAFFRTTGINMTDEFQDALQKSQNLPHPFLHTIYVLHYSIFV